MKKSLSLITVLFCAISLSQNCIAQESPNKIQDTPPFPAKFDKIYTVVDQMPQFPGGQDSLNSFISHNLNYPAVALQYNTEGIVYLTFEVDDAGKIKNITILKDIGGGCGAEAARVVKLMPKWIPGKQNGYTVNVQYDLPVKFQLSKG